MISMLPTNSVEPGFGSSRVSDVSLKINIFFALTSSCRNVGVSWIEHANAVGDTLKMVSRATIREIMAIGLTPGRPPKRGVGGIVALLGGWVKEKSYPKSAFWLMALAKLDA